MTTRGRSGSAFAHNHPLQGWSRGAGDRPIPPVAFYIIFGHSDLLFKVLF